MEGPLVSVVTPVHNGEKYLQECIESIVRQTYENWEYVLVDNCSTDATPDISESFVRSDPRVRYERHEHFVDVIASYNRAFRAIAPESAYCKVVGADDWLFPECLERMVGLAEAHRSVGVVGAYRLDGTHIAGNGMPYYRSVISGREILAQSLLWKLSVVGSPTSTLLRSELVREREPFYDVTFRHADMEAAYWALAHSDFGFIHQALTFTRRPPRSEQARSVQLNSPWVDHIRSLLRYGPQTLENGDYRPWLRLKLRDYSWWLFKQGLKPWVMPSRQRDEDFFAYHRHAAELILAEAPHDPDVRLAMAAVRHLLPKKASSG